tara:strand:+ start:733 stop:837 length:105 start_codon:yes stop_codon:yes gene_type:complete
MATKELALTVSWAVIDVLCHTRINLVLVDFRSDV